jgi:hypothetical protein
MLRSGNPAGTDAFAVCGGKDNSVAVVCVAKLGWDLR